MNDLIRLAAERAVDAFGSTDGTFNAANFSQEFVAMSPTSNQLDGHIVRLLLAGRPDIVPLKGEHYRLKENQPSKSSCPLSTTARTT